MMMFWLTRKPQRSLISSAPRVKGEKKLSVGNGVGIALFVGVGHCDVDTAGLVVVENAVQELHTSVAAGVV